MKEMTDIKTLASRIARRIVITSLALFTASCGGGGSKSFGNSSWDGGGGWSGGGGSPAPTPGGGGGVGSAGEFGATAGGQQELNYARGLVDIGYVPQPEAFAVEAMFSEHDLPIEGAPCERVLCLRAALGIAPDHAGTNSAWVQVGMSSTVDPETFTRPTLATVAVVDISGSMGFGYGEETAGEIARVLLTHIASELTASDHFALVTFGSTAQLVQDFVSGDDPRVSDSIGGLGGGGSTYMEAGLQLGYQVAASAPAGVDDVRVIVFSDYQPNVGATTPSQFQTLVSNAADANISTTILALAAGLDASFISTLSTYRGGNAFSLMERAKVSEFMNDNWPWFVSPIAYDLQVQVEHTSKVEVVQAYGFPGTDATAFDVSSVFLSKRRGGLLLQMHPKASALNGEGASLSINYTTVLGEPASETLQTIYNGQALDAEGRFMSQTGVARATSLALLVEGLINATSLYSADPLERLRPCRPR